MREKKSNEKVFLDLKKVFFFFTFFFNFFSPHSKSNTRTTFFLENLTKSDQFFEKQKFKKSKHTRTIENYLKKTFQNCFWPKQFISKKFKPSQIGYNLKKMTITTINLQNHKFQNLHLLNLQFVEIFIFWSFFFHFFKFLDFIS